MKRIAATLFLGVLVALLVGAGVASAAGTAGQDSATGHVTDARGITLFELGLPCTPTFCPTDPQSNVTADVDFSARSSYNGTDPSGSARFTFRNEDPDQVFIGEVTCLSVHSTSLGAEARISGPITEARGGSTLMAGTQEFEPRSFRITAIDSGKFSTNPDRLGFIISQEQATDVSCQVFAGGNIVREGEVVVKDSLG